jgi:hypothetical protein
MNIHHPEELEDAGYFSIPVIRLNSFFQRAFSKI